MDKLKICLIGASGAGKTSLVSRFVRSIFSERYQTTIGVAIHRRDVVRGGRAAQLVIWDLSGEDEFQNVQPAYLRGAAGYILVIDGTRRDTLDTALTLEARVRAALGAVPFVVTLNKTDLSVAWQLDERDVGELVGRGWTIVRTSAKTGAGVDEMFATLVDAILTQEPPWTLRM